MCGTLDEREWMEVYENIFFHILAMLFLADSCDITGLANKLYDYVTQKTEKAMRIRLHWAKRHVKFMKQLKNRTREELEKEMDRLQPGLY